MGLISEFKAFAMRGNVVDLAVGVVIGAAFGKIVTALVDQVVMPPIGLLIGGVDFSAWKWVLRPALEGQPEVAVSIGIFLNTVIQFLILAFVIFLAIRAMNRMARKEEAAPAPPSPEIVLLTEIRDLLAARQ
jgi:large conductance mechanosensitive channel